MRLLKHKWLAGGAAAAGILLMVWIFCLPRNMFQDTPYSTVVVDKDDLLLGARVADDGQWRFMPCDSLPEKYATAIVEYEDRSFYSHCGVSLRAIGRALWQNASNKRVVSGASTITMQTVRLHRRGKRNVWEKLVEMFMATRLECRYTKDEILCIYASHAPFGGNVVGLKAAMWRYFGSDGTDLSWAEAATLAVLQNAPSQIHLKKNRDLLMDKRNRLLRRLCDKGFITEDDYERSIDEPLIDEPYPLPQHAPHLVDHYHKVCHGKTSHTLIDRALQQRVSATLNQWCEDLQRSGINDLAAVIISVDSLQPIAYCGNSLLESERSGRWVDIARAPRSSGSTLKPLLYYAAMRDGVLMPNMLLPDIPTDFGGFAPKNFDNSYSGAIEANKAVALSLNIPAVYMLKNYGVARFAAFLKDLGFASSLTRSDHDYGLSLILGGAEITLLDLATSYARLAHDYQSNDSANAANIDRVALHSMLLAMREIPRTDGLDWQRASSSRQVAWKTGTSYGSRDAWAVGVTPEYVVAVWAGNADGSGVAGLTGASVAGPVMFDLFDLLPSTQWFAAPQASKKISVCRHSGHPAGRFCVETIEADAPENAARVDACPYCTETLMPDGSALRKFVLPPHIASYYCHLHPEYEMPTTDTSIGTTSLNTTIQITYPTNESVIIPARQLDGHRGNIVCKAAANNPDTQLFWHLDNNYLGETTHLHQINISPTKGTHTLTIIDTHGARHQSTFHIH